jgi:hypothetical protein
MTAREVALYEENTLNQLQAIDLYNSTPQAALGGPLPHDLVYGSREGSPTVGSSTVQFEELQDSSPEQQDSSSERDTSSGHASSCDSPPPKRLRSGEQLGSESPEDSPDPLENPEVSRQERAVLIKMFKGTTTGSQTLSS